MVFWVILISAWVTWFCNFFWSLVNERDLIHTVWCETFLIKLCVFGHDYIYIYNIYIYNIYIHLRNRTSCAEVHELPQSHCGDNWEGILFSWQHIYYALFTSVRFEHSVCAMDQLWPLYIYIYIYIYVIYYIYIYQRDPRVCSK